MKHNNHKNNHSESTKGLKTCFVCKTTGPRSEMMRFVGKPGQQICFDAQEVLPGRGMWLHANSMCLEQAINKRIFNKAAKGTVQIPDNFMEVVKAQLTRYPEKLRLFNQGGIHE